MEWGRRPDLVRKAATRRRKPPNGYPRFIVRLPADGALENDETANGPSGTGR
jgi:hypothetical protein